MLTSVTCHRHYPISPTYKSTRFVLKIPNEMMLRYGDDTNGIGVGPLLSQQRLGSYPDLFVCAIGLASPVLKRPACRLTHAHSGQPAVLLESRVTVVICKQIIHRFQSACIRIPMTCFSPGSSNWNDFKESKTN